MYNFRKKGGKSIGEPFEQSEDGLIKAKEAADVFAESPLGSGCVVEVWWEDEIPIDYRELLTVTMAGQSVSYLSGGPYMVETNSGRHPGYIAVRLRTKDWFFVISKRELTYHEKQ